MTPSEYQAELRALRAAYDAHDYTYAEYKFQIALLEKYYREHRILASEY
jgi:hypothetical protein